MTDKTLSPEVRDGELLEAVARAISDKQRELCNPPFYSEELATAALAAMPRAPSISRDTEVTEAMVEAGLEALREHSDRYLDGSVVVHGSAVEAIYLAMSAQAPRPLMEEK